MFVVVRKGIKMKLTTILLIALHFTNFLFNKNSIVTALGDENCEDDADVETSEIIVKRPRRATQCVKDDIYNEILEAKKENVVQTLNHK